MRDQQDDSAAGQGLSRRTLFGMAPIAAVTLGMAATGAASLAGPASPAHAAIRGLPGDARDIGLVTQPNFAGFNGPRTLATYRIGSDPTSTVRARLYYGEYYDIGEIQRSAPYAQNAVIKTADYINLYRGDGSYITTLGRSDHNDDDRRLDAFPGFSFNGQELERHTTRGARYVRYRRYDIEGGYQDRLHGHWHDSRDGGRWRPIDVAWGAGQAIQFRNGFNNIRTGNQTVGLDLTGTVLNIAWAANITAGSAIASGISGGAGLGLIAAMTAYRVYSACRSWTEGARFMRLIWP